MITTSTVHTLSVMSERTHFDSVEDTVKAIARGELVIVLDDEGRENEGDLIMAASLTTTEKMAFLVKHSSGYVCAPLPAPLADKLGLPLMVTNLEDQHKTAYCVSCDCREDTTTGISAHDRALTVRKLADPTSTSATFNRPGHMLPLRARDGGVLERRGHTEAAVDLCKLAGLPPVGVICELVKADDGLMARRDDCLKFAQEHNLKVTTIDAMVKYLEARAT